MNNSQKSAVSYIKPSDHRAKWDTISDQFKNTTDGLGLEIDPGIIETVVAFNAFGFKTTASCEGHLDWGTFALWIDLEFTENIEADQKKLELASQKAIQGNEIAEKIRGLEENLVKPADSEKMNQLYAEMRQLRREVQAPILKKRQELIQLLTEFYAQHQASYDCVLGLEPIGENFRLSNLGADIQEILDLTTRQQKLTDYQAEMQSFTEFLKKKFLSAE